MRTILSPKWWPYMAIVASAFMLAGAHAFEVIGRMAPCPLCLRQREVYWAALAIAAIGLIGLKAKSSTRGLDALNAVLGLTFLVSAVVAGYHAGAEWEFWPGPSSCAAGLPDSDQLVIDLNQKFSTVSCTEAPWRLFGLSMAGYNALISVGLAALSFTAVNWRPPSPDAAPIGTS